MSEMMKHAVAAYEAGMLDQWYKSLSPREREQFRRESDTALRQTRLFIAMLAATYDISRGQAAELLTTLIRLTGASNRVYLN